MQCVPWLHEYKGGGDAGGILMNRDWPFLFSVERDPCFLYFVNRDTLLVWNVIFMNVILPTPTPILREMWWNVVSRKTGKCWYYFPWNVNRYLPSPLPYNNCYTHLPPKTIYNMYNSTLESTFGWRLRFAFVHVNVGRTWAWTLYMKSGRGGELQLCIASSITWVLIYGSGRSWSEHLYATSMWAKFSGISLIQLSPSCESIHGVEWSHISTLVIVSVEHII